MVEKQAKRRRQKESRSEARTAELVARTAPREERRFVPGKHWTGHIPLGLLGLGAFALGSGVYGQWLRPTLLGDAAAGALPASPWLLFAGTALFGVAWLVGTTGPQPARVGDAGVALEKGPEELQRIAWNEVRSVTCSDGAVIVQARGDSITLALAHHAEAAARVVAEALLRIPQRVELDAAARRAIAEANETHGEVLKLDPPQVAGLRCRSTDKLIALEREARLCSRCGEVYHRDAAVAACATCGAALVARA